MDKDFVTELMKESCKPSLLHSAAQSKWDKATKVLAMPEDEQAAKTKSLEDTAWYVDAF